MKLRVVIDTKIWISYLLTNHFQFLDHLIEEDRILLLYNEGLLTEIIEVASRPKFEKVISKADLVQLVQTLEGFGEYVKSNTPVQASSDVNDNYILFMALDGNADYILSGDKDLLVLEKFHKSKIVSMADFKSALNL